MPDWFDIQLRSAWTLSLLLFVVGSTLPALGEAASFANLDFERSAEGEPGLPDWIVGYVPARPDDPLIDEVLGGAGPRTTGHPTGGGGVCLGSRCVGLVTNPPLFGYLGPLSGEFSLLIQGGTWEAGATFVEQVGDVPSEAKSLRLLAFDLNGDLRDLRVSIDGVELPLVTLPPSPELGERLGADVSRFSGQTVTLRLAVASNFRAPEYFESNILFDDVEFSIAPIPEPAVGMLTLTGLLLLAASRRSLRETHRRGHPNPACRR